VQHNDYSLQTISLGSPAQIDNCNNSNPSFAMYYITSITPTVLPSTVNFYFSKEDSSKTIMGFQIQPDYDAVGTQEFKIGIGISLPTGDVS